MADMASIMADLRKVPWWGWAGGGGAVLGAGYYLYKRHAGASASNATQQQSAAQQVSGTPIPAGLNMADLAGIPYDYQDYDAEYAGDTSGNPGDTTGAPPPAGPFPDPLQQGGISLPATIGAPVSTLANNSSINIPPAAPFAQQTQGTIPVPPPAAPLPAPIAPHQPSVPGAAPFPEYIFEFHSAS